MRLYNSHNDSSLCVLSCFSPLLFSRVVGVKNPKIYQADKKKTTVAYVRLVMDMDFRAGFSSSWECVWVEGWDYAWKSLFYHRNSVHVLTRKPSETGELHLSSSGKIEVLSAEKKHATFVITNCVKEIVTRWNYSLQYFRFHITWKNVSITSEKRTWELRTQYNPEHEWKSNQIA